MDVKHHERTTCKQKLKLKSLDSVLRSNRLRWFSHVKLSELYSVQILNLEVEENRSRGHPKRSWLDTIKDGLRQSNLKTKIFQI